MRVPPQNSSVRESSTSYYAQGREFYDDQYSDGSSVASIDHTLNFSQPIPRENEVKILQGAYDSLWANKKSNNTKTSKEEEWRNEIPSMCLIEGRSGVGKSTLFQLFADSVNQSQSQNASHHKPYILSGKYHEMSSDEPLSAIVEAFNGLAVALLVQQQTENASSDQETKKSEVDELLQRVITRIGGMDAAARLCSIVPSLEPLFANIVYSAPSEGSTSVSSSHHHTTTNPMMIHSLSRATASFNPLSGGGSSADEFSSTVSVAQRRSRKDGANAWNQVKYMFRAFTTVLARQRPVILFLDDLQWCDKPSVELLQDMLLDRHLRCFFFVGAYRIGDDEDGDSNTTKNAVGSHWNYVQRVLQTSIPIIRLNNLTQDGLCQYLRLVLRMEEEEEDDDQSTRLQELAQALYQRTNGNIFFTRNVLEELYSKQLLTFSHMTFTWEWDLNQIPLLDNVLDAVAQRIQSRAEKSPLLRRILILMAYVSRTKVSLKLLQHLVSNIETVNNSSNNNNNGAGMIQDLEMIQELDKAIHDGFLVRDGTGATQYGFSHDRIKEAAFILIPEGTERDGLRRKLGMLLYSVSQDLALGQDWMTIAAADHMNAATKTVKDEEEAIFLTKLNFEAGERCVWVAAFDSASKYLEQATKHLQNNTQQGDPWTFHYSLTLEVFSLRADVELARGNWDVGFKVSEEVLDRGRTIEDKLSTQLSYSKALGRQKSHEESFLSSSGTLQAMGLYPKTPIGMKVGLVRDLMYVRRFVKAKTDEEILTMAPSTDVQLGLAIELFGCAIRQCVYTNRLIDLAALVFKALFLCFHHGQFPQTGRMFLAYAFICDKTGDYGGARRFADLAVAMAAQSPERGLYGWVLYCRTAIFDTWSKSQKEIAELLDVAFKRCMAGGDYESAIIGRSCALECDFLAGTSLVLLDIRCADLVKHSQMYAEALVRPAETIWLPVRHLRGTIDSPLDFDALAAFDEGDEDKAFLTICITSYLAIGVYWSNYGFAEKVVLKAFPPADKSFTRRVPRLFFANIAYNTLYRTDGNRAYRKRGKEAASELRKLSEERGMNSWHRVIIGDAHIKGCTRKKTPGAKDVLAEYDKGIDAALKCHHKHDAALASQLAAEYLIWKMEGGSLDDSHSTSITKYLSDARGWYREWGATNLVRHLEETFSGYLRRDR